MSGKTLDKISKLFIVYITVLFGSIALRVAYLASTGYYADILGGL